jgi:hypothetical protein
LINAETGARNRWCRAHAHNIDERFSNHIIMPGFIDPLLHPSMAALLLRRHFTTAMEWRLPWQNVPSTLGITNPWTG